MIFDRTINDVESAKQIIADKVKTFTELSQEEIEILNRGTITIDTLNRIESAQQDIKELINAMGYWNTNISNHQWEYIDIFKENDFQRIVKNLDVLKNAFIGYSTTPETPLAVYHYENINDIEKILHDLYVIVDDIKSYYSECGTFECGEE